MKSAKLLLAAMIFSVPSIGHAQKNIYFGFRHGESVPSQEKRVCASVATGTLYRNGLTEAGRSEVRRSAETWIKENKPLIEKYLNENRLVVLSSPFSRTLESAFFFVRAIENEFPEHEPKIEIEIENDLRERNFGDFEGQFQSDVIYQQVWTRDQENPTHIDWNVESARDVQKRARELIERLENASALNAGSMYILVAHGDTLSLMETAFNSLDASLHRNPKLIKPFQTAEVRLLKYDDELCRD